MAQASGEVGLLRPRPAARTGLAPARLGLVAGLAGASVLLAAAIVVAVCIGPAGIPLSTLVRSLAEHLGLGRHGVSSLDNAILWKIRLPRVALAAVVGSLLAAGGAGYQGVFRNPLADPYLLGVAAGAGLGATLAIVTGQDGAWVPPAAFIGALVAVTATYLLGTSAARGGVPGVAGSAVAVVLAGVAVTALFTAVQTYVQQGHLHQLQTVYAWILGRLSLADWGDVGTVTPYGAVAAAVLLLHARQLDVLRVGETEAASLGINTARLRLVVLAAATLGTASAVAVSGLIGFVGIIVPHAVRLAVSSSYRVLMPVSMVAGAAFLVLADTAARTVQSPAELPIGVVTAFVGAPFFLFLLSRRRPGGGLL